MAFARFMPFVDLSQCRQSYDALNKLHNYPQRGAHVGGGRHVAQTDIDTSPGWTRRYRFASRHVSLLTYHYLYDTVTESALADPTARARLTAAERTLLDARAALASNSDDVNYTDIEP